MDYNIPRGIKGISFILYCAISIPLYYYILIFNILGRGEDLRFEWGSSGYVVFSGFTLFACMLISVLSMSILGMLAASLWSGRFWARMAVIIVASVSGLWSAYWIIEMTNAFFVSDSLANAFWMVVPVFGFSGAVGLYMIISDRVSSFFSGGEQVGKEK